MPEVSVKIDIPEGTELGEDKLTLGAFNVMPLGCGKGLRMDGHYYLHLRPTWAWPKWLKAAWIAMDAEGNWSWFSHEPCRDARGWWYKVTIGSDTGYLFMANKIGELSHLPPFDFVPPPCDDWKLSKRKNPYLDS